MSKRLGGRRAPTAPQTRLTATPNEILTRRPLLQASMQMESGDDEQVCKPFLRAQFSWDGPPRMLKAPANTLDLTGRKWGRLTVMGLLDMSEWPHKRKSNGAAWVVRCACSMWETRSAKVIKAAKDPDDCCVHCRTVIQRVRQAARVSFFDKHGRWPGPEYAQTPSQLMMRGAAQ